MGKADVEHRAMVMGRAGAGGSGIGLARWDDPAIHDARRSKKTSGGSRVEYSSSMEVLRWRERDVAVYLGEAEAERGDGRESQMRLKSWAGSRCKLGLCTHCFSLLLEGQLLWEHCPGPDCKQVSFIQEVSPIVFGTVCFQRHFQSKHQEICPEFCELFQPHSVWWRTVECRDSKSQGLKRERQRLALCPLDCSITINISAGAAFMGNFKWGQI